MANTFSQIYLQFVFAVSRRQCLIPRDCKAELHQYIGGLVLHRGSKPLAIHCMPDHAHIFIGYKPTIHIPDLVKEIKVETNQFLNRKKLTPAKFTWQEGYGVFSYSQSHIGRVMNYVNNQEVRHSKTNFRVEYLDLLKAFNISFEEKYVFDFL